MTVGKGVKRAGLRFISTVQHGHGDVAAEEGVGEPTSRERGQLEVLRSGRKS